MRKKSRLRGNVGKYERRIKFIDRLQSKGPSNVSKIGYKGTRLETKWKGTYYVTNRINPLRY